MSYRNNNNNEKGTVGHTGVIIGACVVGVFIFMFVAYCLIKKNEEKRREPYVPPTLPRYMTQTALAPLPLAHVRPSTTEQLPAYRPPEPGTNVFRGVDHDGGGYSASAATQIMRANTSATLPSTQPVQTPATTLTGIRQHTIPRKPVQPLREVIDPSSTSDTPISPYPSSAEQRSRSETYVPEVRAESFEDVGEAARQLKARREEGDDQPPGYEQVSRRSS